MALLRLGELAVARGEKIELVVIGGVAMMLGYDAREATKDVDAIILAPAAATVRRLVEIVATELAWPEDWLNDGAKGFVGVPSPGLPLLDGPGISVRTVSTEQLLALKLSAWRDDVDIEDARTLLERVRTDRDRDELWDVVAAFVPPGRAQTSYFAFLDLWEGANGAG